MDRKVAFQNGSITINGEPVILLCSSFFYFRVPQAYWRIRMRDLKRAGYNAIDVYFPWNYHETAPGVWDFSGERDVASFLQCAAEEELYVVARPGPYICSEWDGGGIPAWVHLATDQVRQYDPVYLKMLNAWMNRIMPYIERFQLGKEGSVVMLQIENELDLYPCRHAQSYMHSIRKIVDGYDMHIPYVACVAGKGDVDAATGSVEGIIPSFNIYPPFSDPWVEEKMEILQKNILQPRGWPLLATETEREHHFMRRELASGVRLISPYCQMASTNFDCRNGVSSWCSTPEKRIVYIADNYDMNSMLKSDGAVTAEYLEARLLANMIRTYGTAVAAGTPFADHPFRVETDFRTNDDGIHAMSLCGGGWLLCLPNLGRKMGTASVSWGQEAHRLMIEGDTTRLLPVDVSMARWGYPSARICWCMSDVLWIGDGEMVLCGDGDGLCIETGGSRRIIRENTDMEADGLPLRIRWMRKEEAARAQSPFLPALDQPLLPSWTTEKRNVSETFCKPETEERKQVPVQALEEYGRYDGACDYDLEVPECRYLLLKNGADILSVWQEGRFLNTWISDGAMQRLPVTGGRIRVRSEIWGHTCFDECYLPVLFMRSKRGLEGAYAVLTEKETGCNWHFDEDSGPFGPSVTPHWSDLPRITNYGNLIPKGYVLSGSFRKKIRMPAEGDVRFLSFEGITMRAAVYVNGKKITEVDRTDPWVEITDLTAPGEEAEIIIRVRAADIESTPGRLMLITAKKIRQADIGLHSVESLKRMRAGRTEEIELPLRLRGGECRMLRTEISPEENSEIWLRPEGVNIRTTVITHGHVVGRLFTGCDMNMLTRAGDGDRVWLPREWLREDTEVLMMIEGLRDDAVLSRVVTDKR